jgi:hypothetical protein
MIEKKNETQRRVLQRNPDSILPAVSRCHAKMFSHDHSILALGDVNRKL